jgi:hypothetical protein
VRLADKKRRTGGQRPTDRRTGGQRRSCILDSPDHSAVSQPVFSHRPPVRRSTRPSATERPQERGARLGARESFRVRPSTEAGFALLEAVVAVTIVGLAVVSSLAAFGAQLRGADRARIALEAEALAQERLSALVLAQSAAVRSLPDSLRSGEFTPPF